MELLSCMVNTFHHLRGQQAVFPSGCTILHLYQQRMRVPLLPHTRQHLLFLYFHFILIFLVLGSFRFCFCFWHCTCWHVEVPRLRVELDLQLPAYTTATAMPDLSHVCDYLISSSKVANLIVETTQIGLWLRLRV